MNLSKNNMYSVKYTSILEKGRLKKRKWTSSLKKIIRENRMISIFISLFILCVGINIALISNFINVLKQLQ